jgi:hypothetical protein
LPSEAVAKARVFERRGPARGSSGADGEALLDQPGVQVEAARVRGEAVIRHDDGVRIRPDGAQQLAEHGVELVQPVRDGALAPAVVGAVGQDVQALEDDDAEVPVGSPQELEQHVGLDGELLAKALCVALLRRAPHAEIRDEAPGAQRVAELRRMGVDRVEGAQQAGDHGSAHGFRRPRHRHAEDDGGEAARAQGAPERRGAVRAGADQAHVVRTLDGFEEAVHTGLARPLARHRTGPGRRRDGDEGRGESRAHAALDQRREIRQAPRGDQRVDDVERSAVPAHDQQVLLGALRARCRPALRAAAAADGQPQPQREHRGARRRQVRAGQMARAPGLRAAAPPRGFECVRSLPVPLPQRAPQPVGEARNGN